jgi:hypothetical protein
LDSQSSMRTPRFYGRIGALLVLVTAVTWAVSLLSINPYGSSELPAFDQVAVTPIWPLPTELDRFEASSDHRVFPYSVIPGGAQSSAELQNAVAIDPVVARHYADFDLKNVHRVILSSPQLMHVSYRIGNNVYWTKRKLLLAKGETMLTDGHTMARTRCGNRVSAEPVRPLSASEPAIEDFAAPEFAPAISAPYLAAFSVPAPAISGPAESFVPGVPFIPLPGGGSLGLHPSTIPPPGGGGGGGTPPPGGGGGGGTPPPVGVPEPGTITLVLVSLSAGALLRRRAKSC